MQMFWGRSSTRGETHWPTSMPSTHVIHRDSTKGWQAISWLTWTRCRSHRYLSSTAWHLPGKRTIARKRGSPVPAVGAGTGRGPRELARSNLWPKIVVQGRLRWSRLSGTNCGSWPAIGHPSLPRCALTSVRLFVICASEWPRRWKLTSIRPVLHLQLMQGSRHLPTI